MDVRTAPSNQFNPPFNPTKMSNMKTVNMLVFNYLNSIDANLANHFQKASKMGTTELPDGAKSIQEVVDFYQVHVLFLDC